MRTNSIPYSDQPPGAAPDNARVGNFYRDDSVANGFRTERRFDRFQFAKSALSLDGDESLAAPMGYPSLTQSPLHLLRD